jgi:Spy/CpxP family protein refolding chaperone
MEALMKKEFMAAVAAGSILAIAACAQNPATTTNTTPATPAVQPQASAASGSGMGNGGMRGDRGQRMEEMLFTGISLTTDQQAQVDSIRARHRTDMQGLDPRNNPDDRQKMMQSMQAQMSEIRAVLTPDQQTIFDQNVQKMRDRRGGRGMGGNGGNGGAPPRE